MRHLPGSRFAALVALLCAGLLPAQSGAAVGATDTNVIKALAADAYVWGLGPEYIERFSHYNTLLGPSFNQFKYGSVPAAWNNDASPAGDSSVLYVNGFLDLSGTNSELVLTVPPSIEHYYVAAYYDAYANTIGSIGTRTSPTNATTSYLLVGPKSPYASKPTVTIHGYEYRVMASDTEVSWFIIRVLADTLIDASAPTSVPNVLTNVVRKFALNTRQEFEQAGFQPVYPTNFDVPPPSTNDMNLASPLANTPTNAVLFFKQLGAAIVRNPIPNAGTGLSGTLLARLPDYVVPQYGAKVKYMAPSYGQQETLDSFARIGLTDRGFQIPRNWGTNELQALQDGFEDGVNALKAFIAGAKPPGTNTDYWKIVNDVVGTYPNNIVGYSFRSLIVVEGGVANIPQDAVYPNVTVYQDATGNPAPLDGNYTYKLTFTPPQAFTPPNPVVGTYPPMETDRLTGNPKGFWSVSIYATDSTEAASPFIPQTSVLNTYYSHDYTNVLGVDTTTETNTIRVNPPTWGILDRSTPILFGGDTAAYGLTANTVYYVAETPTTNTDGSLNISIASQWRQKLSETNVPIQNTGSNVSIVTLQVPAAPTQLTWAMVKPVSQLGSTQMAAGQLATNSDGSLTLWFSPTLPSNAPAANWLPTPSTNFYNTLYATNVSTAFEVMIRMYYPTPGHKPPSILPYSPMIRESYIPPLIELVP